MRCNRRILHLLYLILYALFSAHRNHVEAFKEEEFKTCAQAAFCNRNRFSPNADFELVRGSTRLTSPNLVTSTLRNRNAPEALFTLELRLLPDPTSPMIHVRMDEARPMHKRYRVQDVLLPHVESDGGMSLEGVVKESPSDGTLLLDLAASSSLYIQITPYPFTLSVLSLDKKPLVVLNRENLMNFEHQRRASEGDPDGWWEESFRGHTDSKPRGPEAISIDITFPGALHVYGIPERATSLSLQPTVQLESSLSSASSALDGGGVTRRALSEPYRLYNLDVFEYLHDSPFGLYGSIPFLLAMTRDRTVGVFFHNAAEMWVDVWRTSPSTTSSHAAPPSMATQWITESGILDLYLLLGPTPHAVSRQYASLTGTTSLPPLFSLGYHQCRWNYRDEADVKAVDAGFDAHAIPYDVLWLDIEHTNGKRYLTWDQALFPNPADMQRTIASRGRQMVTIVDPHVKRDAEYYIFSEAEKQGLFVRDKDGTSDFEGWCWPGSSSYLDMTHPRVRDWWANQFSLSNYQGSTMNLFIWNDMNEPSVFNGPEITMEKDVRHYDSQYEHRDIHNLYGYYYHMATVDGLRRRGEVERGGGEGGGGGEGARPFVLSRAFFAGTQRLGAIWTGDNKADWEHLRVSMPMTLSLGLTGMTFSGADVGGFFGNPDAELLTRWYQLGAFYPFFRGHAHLETKRREPWLFGNETTVRIRDAIRLRYSILPYLYTLFHQANETGVPVWRPLFYEFPFQEGLGGVDHHGMLGASLLVRPVLDEGATSVSLLLPTGGGVGGEGGGGGGGGAKEVWFDYYTGKRVASSLTPINQVVTLDRIPLYLRGGTILPRRDRIRRAATLMVNDPLTLVIALRDDGSAEGELYLDDGKSFAFQRSGDYLHRSFSMTKRNDGGGGGGAAFRLMNQAAPPSRTLPASRPSEAFSDLRIERIIVLGLPGGDLSAWAVRGSGGVALEAAPGHALLTMSSSGVDKTALVVRQPPLRVGDDWTIEFYTR